MRPRTTGDLRSNRSPDGEWMAHTWSRPEQLLRDSPYYSSSGAPFAEGGSRMQAGLTNAKTGQVILLGGSKGSSWAPVFSPDGQRVAFYADDDGEAGVWIWERSSGKATRFPGVIARPFFGFEYVRWSADGRRLLTKVLPEGLTIAQANDLTPQRDGGRTLPRRSPVNPRCSCSTRRHGPATRPRALRPRAPRRRRSPTGRSATSRC